MPKPFNSSDLRPGNPSPTDPFQLGSLDVIDHVKLDCNGKSGLKPEDFLIVATIALTSYNPFVSTKISDRLEASNYQEHEKKRFTQLKCEDLNEKARPNDFQCTAIDLDALSPGSRDDKDSSDHSSLPPIQRNGPRLNGLGEIKEI